MRVELIRVESDGSMKIIHSIASVDIYNFQTNNLPEIIVWNGRYFVKYTEDCIGGCDYRETTAVIVSSELNRSLPSSDDNDREENREPKPRFYQET